ncbi:MAG TPA: hypothetical protein VI542_06740 [Candidatus Tectomicrobia bacterium]
MRDDSLAIIGVRLQTLERRVRRYQRLTLALGLVLVMGASLAARGTPSVTDVLQAKRFEVVDEVGKVVIAAYATAVGGRLEVVSNMGRQVFSAGSVQGAKEPVGLWEQTLQTIDRQGRELDQQRRLLENLGRQVRNLPQARQASGSAESQSQEFARLRQDIELQRRAVDNVERQLQAFVYQLRSLERR